MAGGKQFATPNFSDAVPPTPPKQGSMGPTHYVDEHTFAGNVSMYRSDKESGWSQYIDDDGLSGHDMDFTAMAGGTGVANKGMGEGIRGFRSTPVGGTFMPGQGKGSGSGATERSNAS